MSQKLKEDASTFWVDPVNSINSSAFAREGGLKKAFLDVGPSSDWGVLILEEDKRIYSEYGRCVIPFYEYKFSILGIRLAFNSFEIEVFNHLMIAPLLVYLSFWRDGERANLKGWHSNT